MKSFLCKVIALVLCLVIILTAVCVYIDPFNVFHVNKIRNNGVEPNKNYIKMKYILNNPEKFDAFLFGSSHVGNIHTDKIPGVKCYNMTCSNGLPDEFLKNIQTLLDNNIVPKKIFLGLDNLSFSATSDFFYNDPYRCPYEYSVIAPAEFWKMYLSPSTVGKALLEIIAEHDDTDSYYDNFYSYGWNYDYGFKKYIDPENRSPEEIKATVSGKIDASSVRVPYERTAETIYEIKKICEENKIDLLVFVTPFYFTQVADENYIGFLRELSKITDFYNFAGYNDLVFDASNFVDMGHYNAEIGDLLIECMFNGTRYDDLYSKGFGWYVTEDNIEEVISAMI